ncbi:unnamed protein product [Arabidopsis halleri]
MKVVEWSVLSFEVVEDGFHVGEKKKLIDCHGSSMPRNSQVDMKKVRSELVGSPFTVRFSCPAWWTIRENSECLELRHVGSLLVSPESSTRASVFGDSTVQRHRNSSGLASDGTDEDSK